MVVERASQALADVLVASNRGPVSYSVAGETTQAGGAGGGSLSAKRGGGGLVSGLSAIATEDSGGDAVWVCAALGDGDREAVRRSGGKLDRADTGGQSVRMLDIPAGTFADAYNGIANSVLWFVHHMLYQTPLEPSFGAEFEQQWASYERYNAAFADALADEAAEGATVLVQDYHLTLVPALLRERRPDLRIGHFSHTPWAPPDYYRMLPDAVAEQVLRGVLGADRAAFLTRRWARGFADCCVAVLGAAVAEDESTGELEVTCDGRTTRLGVHGLGADAEFLRERAGRDDVDERIAILREQIGSDRDGRPRRALVRVDRTELSKNIVRGLHAYGRLLADRPEWRERVVHLALAYPSRQDLAVYRDYMSEVSRVAEEINSTYGTESWTPVVLFLKDDFARSLAAYRLADVALVNPIRDGMNLVAKEVPVVSDDGCALVLSREAGAYAELGEDSLVVNPYDIADTARALHEALTMEHGRRAERTKRLAAAATALPPTRWFLDQLHALRDA
ncbi:alpha,alpha-trehalose-phosphate synthase [Streptomyces abyssalis]|uniref:Alpha,alpha-trehalose-phosphate synthase n=1 Tax=Streptomyces abyssalis TaxID=933944 RepID=A0A1E7JNN5_9ACTN|nr:trehalose-6-phosphate synthase [Streptomyces abyssalis]OEU86716.1 alpha,alpha-trehalose-phosphate synthase [Streptomyces abyssalis]OEU89897.1 alpha,alpha-trehalose-phosphate synthase [Streptomyces abyssalis]